MSSDTAASLGSDQATARPSPELSMAARKRSMIASTAGNLLEFYEWSVYAVFAPFIAAVMFDSTDPVSALLSTLAVFAVGFLVRPLGGVVFGRIADRKGRKFVLITTMLLMAFGSLAIGLLPTYATIGAWASVLLLLCRILQGFAHGGESAAANTYVAEMAPAAKRGLWGSIVFIAVFGGSVIAYTVGGAVTTGLSEGAVEEWGWRIPFLLGAVFAVVVLYLRRNMDETDVFHDQRPEVTRESAAPLPECAPQAVNRGMIRRVLLVIGLVSGLTTVHYTWSSYVSTYAITQHGMDANSAFWALMAAQALSVITIPFWGMLSDKIGRRPLWIGFGVAMVVLAIPLREMISDQPWTLFVPAFVALTLVAGPGAILAATMAEAFPTHARTQGIGFAYSFAVAAFGGSAPYLNALVLDLGMGWMSGAYIMLLCVFTLTAALVMKETRGKDLRTV